MSDLRGDDSLWKRCPRKNTRKGGTHPLQRTRDNRGQVGTDDARFARHSCTAEKFVAAGWSGARATNFRHLPRRAGMALCLCVCSGRWTGHCFLPSTTVHLGRIRSCSERRIPACMPFSSLRSPWPQIHRPCFASADGIHADGAAGADEPAPTPLVVGDPAPVFSFAWPAADGRWHRLRRADAARPRVDRRSAPPRRIYRALGRLRDAFRELGVTLVAVFNLPTRSTRALADRLNASPRARRSPISVFARSPSWYNGVSLRPSRIYHLVRRPAGRAPSCIVVGGRCIILRASQPTGRSPTRARCSARAPAALGLPLPANALCPSWGRGQLARLSNRSSPFLGCGVAIRN